MDLANKVAIITGASSGIGNAISKEFARLGASLVICGKNEATLDSLIHDCEPTSRNRIIKVAGDLKDDEVLRRLVSETIKRFKKIDILVNNASMSKVHSILDMPFEEYDEVMQLNLRSPVFLTKLCVPYLIQTKGSVVNISSVVDSGTFTNALAYSISKTGLNKFTKCAAMELAPKGVRVNSINPGVNVSETFHKFGLNTEQLNKFFQYAETCHPLGKIGHGTEVARMAAFLASNDALLITGEVTHVDGGWHATIQNMNTFSKLGGVP